MGLGRVTRPHEHRANPACTLRGGVCVLTRTHLGVPLCGLSVRGRCFIYSANTCEHLHVWAAEYRGEHITAPTDVPWPVIDSHVCSEGPAESGELRGLGRAVQVSWLR